jgi:hypothetical protein
VVSLVSKTAFELLTIKTSPKNYSIMDIFLNMTEKNVLHLLLLVVGCFIVTLVLFDLCDPTGTSYHNWLVGKANDHSKSKFSHPVTYTSDKKKSDDKKSK